MIVEDTITKALVIIEALLAKKAKVVIISSNQWYLDCETWELFVFKQTQQDMSCHREIIFLEKLF